MKNKQPKSIVKPNGKEVRAASNPGDTNSLSPVWSVTIFDAVGPWGKCRVSLTEQDDHLWGELFQKLRGYETLTWGVICQNKKYNHPVPVDSLVKNARDRLSELKLDDVDSLFRFRLSGERRVWGIREGRVFKILWWDPEHEVCPSNLKNT